MPRNLQIVRNKFSILLILLLVVSCSNTKGWVYKSNSYQDITINGLQGKNVAISPFADKRSNENKNNIMLYLVPLVPFGYQNLSSPETVPVHANSGLWVNFNPKEDFAKAMAEEFNSIGVAKEAYFSNSIRESDYYISGEIISTDYKSKLMSYGLSVYGPLLWYIGFPATHVANDLEIKLSLIDTKTKKVIFVRNYKADHYGKIGWIYAMPNDFRYSEMLAELYKKFFTDLSKENLFSSVKKNN